jgi:DnaJ-class molecular chaperone
VSFAARHLRRSPRRPVVDEFATDMTQAADACPDCDQYGRVDGKPCRRCGGTGELPKGLGKNERVGE